MWERSPCQPHPTTSVRGYSHHGAGVASLLAALADQESAVPLAAQHLFCLQAVDLPHVPRSFLMVGQLLLIVHHGVLAAIEHRQGQTPSVWACGPHISPHTASCCHPFWQGRCPQLPGREMGLARNPEAGRTGCAACAPAAPHIPQHPNRDTHSSVSFLMPSHSLIFFCRAPFCVSHLEKEKQNSAQAACPACGVRTRHCLRSHHQRAAAVPFEGRPCPKAARCRAPSCTQQPTSRFDKPQSPQGS